MDDQVNKEWRLIFTVKYTLMKKNTYMLSKYDETWCTVNIRGNETKWLHEFPHTKKRTSVPYAASVQNTVLDLMRSSRQTETESQPTKQLHSLYTKNLHNKELQPSARVQAGKPNITCDLTSTLQPEKNKINKFFLTWYDEHYWNNT